MIEWHSVAREGLPPSLTPVIVTVLDEDIGRYVDYDIRYLSADCMKEECYRDEYIAAHPNGIWEWAYEAGAGYWESYDRNIIAWAYPSAIEPYQGE